MKVVADSSPLIVLAGAGLPGASGVAKAEWIKVKQIESPENLAAVRTRFGIGLGELATIVLAKEVGISLC